MDAKFQNFLFTSVHIQIKVNSPQILPICALYFVSSAFLVVSVFPFVSLSFCLGFLFLFVAGLRVAGRCRYPECDFRGIPTRTDRHTGRQHARHTGRHISKRSERVGSIRVVILVLSRVRCVRYRSFARCSVVAHWDCQRPHPHTDHHTTGDTRLDYTALHTRTPLQ